MAQGLALGKNQKEIHSVTDAFDEQGEVLMGEMLNIGQLGVSREFWGKGRKSNGPKFEIVDRGGVVLGVFIEDKKGQKVFLPRSPGIDMFELVEMLTRLVKDSTLDIAEGCVTVEIGKTRFAVEQLGILGVLPPEEDKQEVVFDIPTNFSPSRLAMAAKFDTEEKRKWRTSLSKCAENLFGSAENIPKNARHVLCFPGLGQEAYMWKAFGFKNEEMIFVESDPQLADELEETFKGAKVIRMDFKRGKAVYKQVKQYLGIGKQLSILSVDPNNQWSKTFANGFKNFIDDMVYAPEINLFARDTLVSMCFSSGRGDDVKWWTEMLTGVGIDMVELIKDPSLLKGVRGGPFVDRIRMAAVQHALGYSMKQMGLGGEFNHQGYYRQKLLNKGRYRGDGNQYMYFAMHHVTTRRDCDYD